MKKLMSLVLCIGLLQCPLQATPFAQFREECRKWVSRGAAVGYWWILSATAIVMCPHIQRHTIEDGAIDFKKYYPLSYAEIQQILQQEGLPGLDDYTILCVPGFNNWARVGNKRLIMPLQFTYDCEEAAAILSHEMAHDYKNHREKKALIGAVTPFAIHAIGKGIYNKIIEPQPISIASYPTITRSLLRLVRAPLVLPATVYLQAWYSRKCEKQADESVRSSEKLSLVMANTLQNQVKNRELLSWRDSHPPISERIAYLKEWAAEAKEKKESAK